MRYSPNRGRRSPHLPRRLRPIPARPPGSTTCCACSPTARSLGPTTLYVTLRRLLTNGFVAEAAPRADPALDDKPRDYYRITPQGKEALRTPGLVPLPPRTIAQERQYAVLCALADGAEHHGYGLLTDLRAAQGGAGCVGSGALYRTLDDLRANGLVVEAGERPDPAVNPDAPRRHYRLAPRGEEARHMLATLPPPPPRDRAPWRGAVATIITTGAGLLRRDEAT